MHLVALTKTQLWDLGVGSWHSWRAPFYKLVEMDKFQSNEEMSPWGRSHSAGPSLLWWRRRSVGNIFIPAFLVVLGLGQPLAIFSSKPVHTEAAPSPAEVAAIHTEQVLADKNIIQAICLRFDIFLQDCSKRKPVVFETGAGSSKMVSY